MRGEEEGCDVAEWNCLRWEMQTGVGSWSFMHAPFPLVCLQQWNRLTPLLLAWVAVRWLKKCVNVCISVCVCVCVVSEWVRAGGLGGGKSVNGICAANSWTGLFKHRQAIATDRRLTWREEEPGWTFMTFRSRWDARIYEICLEACQHVNC